MAKRTTILDGYFKKQNWLECQRSVSTSSNETTTDYCDDYDEDFGEADCEDSFAAETLLENLVAVLMQE